jgi:nicotinate-nucleotide--dimethylbenzimidazole phosphoribosyltransferase
VSLDTLLGRIRPVDAEAARAAQATLDAKAKPRGSLGELEAVACRIAAIRGTASPGRLRAALVLAAGDHGYARRGVSAYPQEVTQQMLAAFVAGGSAIDVLARAAGLRLVVVDAGVLQPSPHPEIRQVRLGAGTADATVGPAMKRDDAIEGILAGAAIAEELADEGHGIAATGDMGIGNTTASAALSAALLPAEPEDGCGRGTGVDDQGLRRKVEAVRLALAANRLDPDDPVGVLAAVGGFEHAVLAGVCLGGSAAGCVVLLDGFVTGAAALVAARLAPAAAGFMVASHRSPEPGHALVLADLGLRPLLDLDLRLGEGSGAALALPLVSAALAILSDMATFDSAGVTDAGA